MHYESASTHLDQAISRFPDLSEYIAHFSLPETTSNFQDISKNPEYSAVLVILEYAKRCAEYKVRVKNKVETYLNRNLTLTKQVDMDTAISVSCTYFQETIKAWFDDWLAKAKLHDLEAGESHKTVKGLEAEDARFARINSLTEILLDATLKLIFSDLGRFFINTASHSAETQIEFRLKALRAQQTRDKAVNTMVRRLYPSGNPKAALTPEKVTTLKSDLRSQFEMSSAHIEAILTPDNTGRVIPVSSKTIMTRSQEIIRLERRLLDLRKLIHVRESRQLEGKLRNGITYWLTNYNHIGVCFSGEPEKHAIEYLYKKGFRWSARYGIYQRKHTTNAQRLFLEDVLPFLKSIEGN